MQKLRLYLKYTEPEPAFFIRSLGDSFAHESLEALI